MDGELTSDGVRTHSFRAAWRGYRRADVDKFLQEVAARLEYLENRLIEASAKLDQLGIEDVPELSRELGKVGDDVAAILEEARRASTDMRTRAAADAASWRREAKTDARAMQTEAEAAAEQLRSDAWQEASRALADARDEAENIVASGHQDVLFIRAEAEREVMHLSGEARRESDELVRNAQAEAAQILAAAEAEARQIVDAAERAVEGARELTRSLEQRRTELIGEIDAAQITLEALQDDGAEAEQAEHSSEESADSQWGKSADGAVRVVAASSLSAPGPVDADELVAEVEQLRSARRDEAARTAPLDVADEDGRNDIPEPGPGKAAVAADDAAGADPTTAASSADSAPMAVADDAEQEEADDEPDAGGSVDRVAAVDAGVGHATPGQELDALAEDGEGARQDQDEAPQAEDSELAGLFAQLREPSAPTTEPEAKPDEAPDRSADVDATSENAVPHLRAVPISGPPGEGAFELRERLLLPIENAGLREVKRHLVELQNLVLEELRTATGRWEPDPDEFLAEMSDGMASLRSQAFAAGVEAVEQMTGRPANDLEVPPGDRGTRDFAESLIAAVSGAHGAAVAKEAGSRELASAVSRVFRAWRTDEAERRLRHAAYAAYHQGALAGFVAVGVTAVTAVTEGLPCAECPAGREWSPGVEPPAGCEVPPAHLGCATTIVPAGMAG